MRERNTRKVCLINPPTTDPSERDIYFPMALITLGGVLKKAGYEAELWDFDLYFKRVGNTSERSFRKMLRHGIAGAQTPIFGISSICSNFPMALWIAKEIKEYRPDSLVILGGPQPSSVPEIIMRRFEFVDFVVMGEGEVTLEEMTQVGFDREKLKSIPGVAFRRGEEIVTSHHRTLVGSMDNLPFPDFSLINFEEYRQVRGPAFTPCIEVGRGCPFHCIFCSTALMWEKDFRVKSPQRIVAEMDYLNQHFGFEDFDFIHDNFTTSRKFVLDFCAYLEDHEIKPYTWSASSRTDCINVERLEKMHAVGLRGLFFGLETGSERMQQAIKKNLDFEHFEPIIRRCNELGVNTTTAFILGFPDERAADIHQTLARALHYKELGTTRVFFSKLTALTGTSLYRENLSHLKEFSVPSTISPQNYALPYIRHLISSYPDLFSSYYHVPHPEYGPEYLCKAVEFFHFLVNWNSAVVLLLMEKLEIPALELFSLWEEWSQEHGIEYFNYRIYNLALFKVDFQRFLDEVVFREAMQAWQENSQSVDASVGV